MTYVRIYSDAQGETHFEDVAAPVTVERYASAEWQISQPFPVSSLRFRRVTVEYPESPHVAPRRQFIIHLAGEAEIEVSDGEVRRFGPGSVLLLEDLEGSGHTTRRVGDVVRETLFVALDG
jgi:hypothetical protein